MTQPCFGTGRNRFEHAPFPRNKTFCRPGLSPKNKQSGKMKRRIKSSGSNYAGEIFRQSTQSLSVSKYNAIGSFIRRLKGKKGRR
jgi:hypothetical protein